MRLQAAEGRKRDAALLPVYLATFAYKIIIVLILSMPQLEIIRVLRDCLKYMSKQHRNAPISKAPFIPGPRRDVTELRPCSTSEPY